MTLLTLKRANGLKTSYGVTLDKLLVFLTKSASFLRILTLKRKNQVKMVKNKTCVAFNLKTANVLKTSYGETLDKLLVFFDPKYHFHENLHTKTQKLDENGQKQNLCRF